MAHRKECLKRDIKYSKIKQLFKDQDPEELKACKKVLLNHYEKIVHLFDKYAHLSSFYPKASIGEIIGIIKSTDF